MCIRDSLTPAQIAEKKALLSRYGLTVSALCGDLGGHGFARKDENPEKIEKSKRIVDLALALDSRVVTTHIGVVPEDDTCDTYKILQEACNELAEYAHQNGAFFAIETGPEPAERLRKFLDSLDSKGCLLYTSPQQFLHLGIVPHQTEILKITEKSRMADMFKEKTLPEHPAYHQQKHRRHPGREAKDPPAF